MRNPLSALTWALFAAAGAADAVLAPRQGTSSLDSITCGRVEYTKDQVDAAVSEGCRLHAAGRQIGRSNYPHRYNNFEGFDFAAEGPYQEFPILSGGAVYTGNSPGPDRVVFNPNLNGACVYVGAITHTGAASRGAFVECTETKRSNSGSSSTTTSGASPTATDQDTSGAGRLAGWAGSGLVVGAVAGLLVL